MASLVELLAHRVLRVRGADAVKFLQGMCTNDVRALLDSPAGGAGASSWRAHAAQHTAFLTSKGRTIAGASIALAAGGDVPTFFLEVRGDGVAPLLAHLRAFKLRARVELDDVSETHAAFSLLPPGGGSAASLNASLSAAAHVAARASGGDVDWAAFWDPRGPPSVLGGRVIAPRLAFPDAARDDASVARVDSVRRAFGAAEGAEAAGLIPLEWNLTLLRGVCFAKGCYIGQELVARTHFRGLVRKRVLPAIVSDAAGAPSPAVCADAVDTASRARVASPADFRARPGDVLSLGAAPLGARSAGRVIAGAPIGGLALVLMRLSGLEHTLPMPPSVRASAPDGSAPAQGSPNRETLGGWPSDLPPVDATGDEREVEFADDGVARAELRARAAARDLYISAAPPARDPYRITPVLPLWWTRVAHEGIDDGTADDIL